ncbi:Os06g0516800, partial [Oryza sativa Japonica Group]
AITAAPSPSPHHRRNPDPRRSLARRHQGPLRRSTASPADSPEEPPPPPAPRVSSAASTDPSPLLACTAPPHILLRYLDRALAIAVTPILRLSCCRRPAIARIDRRHT